MKNKKISIIILNWNGWEDTIECLESLFQIKSFNFNIIVVDNGSNDDSLKKIREYASGKLSIQSDFFQYSSKNKPINITELSEPPVLSYNLKHSDKLFLKNHFFLIKNKKNYGFAEGNNIGIRFSIQNLDPFYILLLNNDTVVDKEFLNKMILMSKSDEKIGVIGPKTYYYSYNNRKDVLNSVGGRYKKYLSKPIHIGIGKIDSGQFDRLIEVDYVEGSCLLIKTHILKEMNLINPFLFGWEEIDIAMKTYKMGYKCCICTESKIWHKVGASTGGKFGLFHLYYHIRSGLIVINDNMTFLNKIISIPLFFTYVFFKILIMVYYSRKKKDLTLNSIKIVICACSDFYKINSGKMKFKSFKYIGN